ncbi:MAG: uroporphyrinogen decarboxylase [Bacteroidales bacterium]|nr:uroporphyrinogen decarboxylase [Bacteroidales bacterium]
MQNSILLDTIKGIKRERPPVWFMRQAGRVLPSYSKLREKYSFRELMLNPELAAQVTLLPVNDLGVDAAILFSDILVIPEALGMKINFTDKGPVFETPLSDARNQIPYLNSDSSKLEHIYKTIDIIRKQKTANIPLIGFCGAPFTTFCYMVQGNSANHNFSEAIKLFYNDRETALKLLEIITELSIEYAVSQAKHRIDIFQLFETHAGLLPSDLYIELILPFVKRITSAVKAKEVPVIFFPKGLGHAISRLNPDIADIVSIDWQFSIVEAWEIIDSKIGLQGNLDPRILSVDNKEIITKELEKFVPFGRNEYKWIFNTGHGLLPDNIFENVKFVVDWIKSANWYRS